MFSKLLVFVGLVAVVFGATMQQQVPIVSLESDISPDGSFQWSYQSGDGSQQQQAGQLKQIGQNQGEIVQGNAAWTDPEGGQHQLSYVADENGYQPQGDDLPVAPAVPEAIARSLEYNAAHPEVVKGVKSTDPVFPINTLAG